jgi:hypothetical protein
MMKKVTCEKQIGLPFSAACRVCRNNMLDICAEDCSVYKDFKSFEPNEKMNPFNLPKFNMKEYEELPGKVKGEFLAFYLVKLMEVLYVPAGQDFDDPRSG